MPKVSLNETEKRHEKIRTALANNIKAEMAKLDIHSRMIILKMGFSRATFYSRQKHPGQYTLDEIMNIADALHMSIPALLGMEPANASIDIETVNRLIAAFETVHTYKNEWKLAE